MPRAARSFILAAHCAYVRDALALPKRHISLSLSPIYIYIYILHNASSSFACVYIDAGHKTSMAGDARNRNRLIYPPPSPSPPLISRRCACELLDMRYRRVLSSPSGSVVVVVVSRFCTGVCRTVYRLSLYTYMVVD